MSKVWIIHYNKLSLVSCILASEHVYVGAYACMFMLKIVGCKAINVCIILQSVQDSDQRVREACQRAMMHFIVQAKKHFAPYLKSVLGHWVCGMNDPYIPAATAAREAFESTFSEAKRIEVYKYAFREILSVSTTFLHP